MDSAPTQRPSSIFFRVMASAAWLMASIPVPQTRWTRSAGRSSGNAGIEADVAGKHVGVEAGLGYAAGDYGADIVR